MKFSENANGDLVIDYQGPRQLAALCGVGVYRPVKFLYRYSRVSENLLESLAQGYLWYSRPRDFNDPFDCNIWIRYPVGINRLKEYINVPEELSRKIEEGDADTLRKLKNLKLDGDYSYLERFDLDLGSCLLRGDERSLNIILNATKFASLSTHLDESIGVCCFTSNAKNPLMWSHYASQHSGICLKYKSLYGESGLLMTTFPVNYMRRMRRFVWKEGDVDNEAKVFFRGIYTKSYHWHYESEWRALWTTGVGKREFAKTDLSEVIFGVNTTEKDISRVKDCLNSYEYRHVISGSRSCFASRCCSH